jgi:hypothetical protein
VNYEIGIDIKEIDKDQINNIALGLLWAGYDIYLSWDREKLCFNTNEEDVEVKK